MTLLHQNPHSHQYPWLDRLVCEWWGGRVMVERVAEDMAGQVSLWMVGWKDGKGEWLDRLSLGMVGWKGGSGEWLDRLVCGWWGGRVVVENGWTG